MQYASTDCFTLNMLLFNSVIAKISLSVKIVLRLNLKFYRRMSI